MKGPSVMKTLTFFVSQTCCCSTAASIFSTHSFPALIYLPCSGCLSSRMISTADTLLASHILAQIFQRFLFGHENFLYTSTVFVFLKIQICFFLSFASCIAYTGLFIDLFAGCHDLSLLFYVYRDFFPRSL